MKSQALSSKAAPTRPTTPAIPDDLCRRFRFTGKPGLTFCAVWGWGGCAHDGKGRGKCKEFAERQGKAVAVDAPPAEGVPVEDPPVEAGGEAAPAPASTEAEAPAAGDTGTPGQRSKGAKPAERKRLDLLSLTGRR